MNMLIEASEKDIALEEFSISTIYVNSNESSHFHPIIDSLDIYQTILKYSFSSLITTIIDFVFFSILIGKDMGIILATYISRLCSMVVNFAINRKIVFRARGNFLHQFLKYGALVIVSGTCSGVMIEFLSNYFGVLPILCKVVIDTLLYFINYYVQRTFIFIKGDRRNDDEK